MTIFLFFVFFLYASQVESAEALGPSPHASHFVKLLAKAKDLKPSSAYPEYIVFFYGLKDLEKIALFYRVQDSAKLAPPPKKTASPEAIEKYHNLQRAYTALKTLPVNYVTDKMTTEEIAVFAIYVKFGKSVENFYSSRDTKAFDPEHLLTAIWNDAAKARLLVIYETFSKQQKINPNKTHARNAKILAARQKQKKA